MIRRFVILCFLLVVNNTLSAQKYGNEWINYSQDYYKIKITQEGIYRITDSLLSAAGIPIGSIDPRNFQLFHNGEEQAIYIEGESDGVFNSSDFIEFYATQNDGILDSLLYDNVNFVPNPYYSLINDTAVYFLTWNSSTANNRMDIETDVAFSFYAPSTYFLKEQVNSYNSTYYAGETDAAGGTDCAYTESEGYFDRVININNSLVYSLNTTNIYSLGPNVIAKLVLVGASKDKNLLNQGKDDHHITIGYKKSTSSSYSPLSDTTFKGYAACRFVYSLSPLNFGTTQTDFQVRSFQDGGFTTNRTAVSYVSVKYPHTFDLEGKASYKLWVEDHPAQVKSYLNISNFSATSTVRLYDLTYGKRIDAVLSGGNYKVLLPNGGGEKVCYLTSEGNVMNITSIEPVTATAKFTDFSIFSADSAFVIVTHKSLLAEANDYKDYRSTNVFGGQHNVVLAEIDELYDQFAYGIVKSPFSVRGFCHYLMDTYPTPPQNLFLIGKSLHNRLVRQNSANYANSLVPSFGNPSSDNLFTAGLNGTNLEPAIPTGRLAAKTGTDVTVYLDKIIEYEDQINNPPAEWKKKVLHFGGGKKVSEQTTFKQYLANYRDTIENVFYGAEVTEFFKTNSAPIQINTSENLRNIINEGVSLMTFFGHSSATMGFDQSIDDVNTYDPIRGHYPLLLANGCFVGDIHSTDLSTSETYLMTPNKGFVGFIGTVGLGVPYALNVFSQEFYNQLSRKNYNRSIGSTMQKTVNVIQSGASSDALITAVCNEMNLHGDPSLKINTYDKPDFKITSNNVFFDLTSEVDTFTVYVVRTNIGMLTNDSIFTEVIRTLPNGDRESLYNGSAMSSFKDTLAFRFPIDLSDGIGLNMFSVSLDTYNEVDELNENNNTVSSISVLIEGVGILPVYPYEFAIIPTDTITLRASTVDLFAPATDYLFQFDTIDTFDSPFMVSTTINSPGGVIRWKPPVTFTDSAVYYWRVSPDSNDTNGYQWKERSFQYIINKRGWGQAHFFQFKDDDYTYVSYNRPQRKYDFVNDVITVQCHDAIYYSAPNFYLIQWHLNGYEMDYWHCNQLNPSFSIVILDPITGKNIESPNVSNLCSSCNNGVYKESHCLSRTFNKLDYLVTNSTTRGYLVDFLNNDSLVPPGSYMLAYSINQVNYSGFEESFFQAFENFGSSQIRSIPASRPYIMWGRKGDPIGSATEMVGASLIDKLDFTTSFTTNFNSGTIESPVIGPASNWGSFHWRQHPIDGPALGNSDEVQVEIIGIKGDATEVSLVTFPEDSIDVLYLSNYIDAAVYPKIRLVASMKDDSLHTPPQMERWQVIFDEVPEGSINPQLGYYISSDTLQEGTAVIVHLPFQNISETTFPDSLLFTYWNEDVNGVNTELFTTLQRASLAPNEVIIDTVEFSTSNYVDINALWMEVNPINRTYSQLEQYHYNNILRIPIYISSDKINPLLDVTFDGIHILDRDIVSAKPTILIKLKDENQFLALNDTSDFNIFIQGPSDLDPKKVYFNSVMSFVPAVLPDNSCEIYYTPTFTEDGIYKLIVQAKDQSDNLAGAIDYAISFEVINKSTITQVMNYPNPFSTSTKFVFTITGTEIPTYFKIQILNISGTVVREITQAELGYIHIGRNITEYAWDGKDEFGDQLANGVYLYRVVTNINGNAIEKRNSGADQYFEKGFGKMYLMR